MENHKKTGPLTDNNEPIGDAPPLPDNPGPNEGERYCFLHPDTRAFKQCPVCGHHYCPRCLVHYFGTYYCEKCGAVHAPQQPEATRRRDRPVRSSNIPTDSAPLPPDFDESPQARRAIKLALFGLVPVIGIVLDIMALIRAFNAFTELGSIKGMRGTRKAVLAMMISIVWLVGQIIAILFVLSRYVLRA